jgi:hypothetical protein
MGAYSSLVAHAKTQLNLLRLVFTTLLHCIVMSFVDDANIQCCEFVLCKGLSLLETEVANVKTLQAIGS